MRQRQNWCVHSGNEARTIRIKTKLNDESESLTGLELDQRPEEMTLNCGRYGNETLPTSANLQPRNRRSCRQPVMETAYGESPNLGPIWVRLTGSKSSLEDQERAVSTVEIQ